MATPVGRSAEQLKIYIDNAEAAVIDRARKLEMTLAIQEFCRQRKPEIQPGYSWN